MTPDQQAALDRLRLIQQEINDAKQLADIYSSLGPILEEQNRSFASRREAQKRINGLIQEDKNLTKLIAQSSDEIGDLKQRIVGLTGDELVEANKVLDNLAKQKEIFEQTQKLHRVQIQQLQQNASLLKTAGNELKDQVTSWAKQEFGIRSIWGYLQEFDGAVRKYQLSLGAAGEKADMIRKQTENSVNASARFGANIKDIVELQSGLNDLTGKSNVFREKDILDLVAITKGTGMQNEEVTKLVGNMMLFGSSIGDAKSLVQNTVNETSKMGLNSSKVMKSLSMNIDKMDSYRFQGGVDGLKKMVMASEKFRFSMEGALAAADKFRTLEGLLEAGATLRVLGGEFAKMDEFKLSFLARNKPEEFAVEMAKLTKGMATFNKETGTFDITDVDFDKLRVVAESTGRSLDDVVKSTRQINQMEFAKKQIFAGTDEEKEMIAKLATFKKGSSMGFIQIGDKNVNLNELTKTQIGLYVQQQKTLEERSKDSQTFNESFNNTIMQIKASLLPLLTYINKGLEKFNSMIDGLRDSSGALGGWVAAIPIGGLLLGMGGGAIIMGLTRGLFGLIGSGMSKMFGKMGVNLGGGGGGGMSVFTSGIKNLAGIGIAAVGIGAGMFLAAKGVASLAEAFSKLNTNQLIGVNVALVAMGATMAAIAYFAPALGAAAPEIAAFAGSLALLGGAVLLAGVGIGEMFKGFASMWNTKNINFTGIEALGAVDFNNMDKLKVLQNFKQSDIDRMQEMFNVLNQINSIDTSKLSALQSLFSNMSLKFTLDGDAVLKSTVNVDFGKEFGAKLEKFVDERVPIAMNKGQGPK
jgi:hypothetical protein